MLTTAETSVKHRVRGDKQEKENNSPLCFVLLLSCNLISFVDLLFSLFQQQLHPSFVPCSLPPYPFLPSSCNDEHFQCSATAFSHSGSLIKLQSNTPPHFPHRL